MKKTSKLLVKEERITQFLFPEFYRVEASYFTKKLMHSSGNFVLTDEDRR